VISDWIFQGECRKPGHNPDWWWAEASEPIVNAALHLCWQCPVREKCLAHALDFPEHEGVWGGHLPHERRRIRALERERRCGRGVIAHGRQHLEDTPQQIAARRQALKEATA
jgi:WhiB family redox-sensing transcriptional regulator